MKNFIALASKIVLQKKKIEYKWHSFYSSNSDTFFSTILQYASTNSLTHDNAL